MDIKEALLHSSRMKSCLVFPLPPTTIRRPATPMERNVRDTHIYTTSRVSRYYIVLIRFQIKNKNSEKKN